MELNKENLEKIKFLMQLNPLPYFFLTVDGRDALIVNKYGSEWINKATLDDLKRVMVF